MLHYVVTYSASSELALSGHGSAVWRDLHGFNQSRELYEEEPTN